MFDPYMAYNILGAYCASTSCTLTLVNPVEAPPPVSDRSMAIRMYSLIVLCLVLTFCAGCTLCMVSNVKICSGN